jgi:hypothetical protein
VINVTRSTVQYICDTGSTVLAVSPINNRQAHIVTGDSKVMEIDVIKQKRTSVRSLDEFGGAERTEEPEEPEVFGEEKARPNLVAAALIRMPWHLITSYMHKDMEEGTVKVWMKNNETQSIRVAASNVTQAPLRILEARYIVWASQTQVCGVDTKGSLTFLVRHDHKISVGYTFRGELEPFSPLLQLQLKNDIFLACKSGEVRVLTLVHATLMEKSDSETTDVVVEQPVPFGQVFVDCFNQQI